MCVCVCVLVCVKIIFVVNIPESWEIQSGVESSSSSFSFVGIPSLETLLSENEL